MQVQAPKVVSGGDEEGSAGRAGRARAGLGGGLITVVVAAVVAAVHGERIGIGTPAAATTACRRPGGGALVLVVVILDFDHVRLVVDRRHCTQAGRVSLDGGRDGRGDCTQARPEDLPAREVRGSKGSGEPGAANGFHVWIDRPAYWPCWPGMPPSRRSRAELACCQRGTRGPTHGRRAPSGDHHGRIRRCRRR